MSNMTVDEVKQYILLDKKIVDRASKIAQEFNLAGGEFDSTYVDYYDTKPMLIIEMGQFIHGEYTPTIHYLTPEEFCLPNGKELFETRIQKEYEELKKELKDSNSKRKVYKINFEE